MLLATLPCEIWKSNIFVFQKQSLPLLVIFFHSALSVAAKQSGSEPRRLCGVEDPTRACVQAPQDHRRGRAAPACRGGMGSSGPGSDWQRDQWMAHTTDSLRCSRWRTFWTFTLNITAFVHIQINMFWTLLALLSVKQVNFFCTSNSLAVIVNFRISQSGVATQLKCGGNCYHSYSDSFLGNLSVKKFWKSVNICRSYDQKTKWLFFRTLCTSVAARYCTC